MTEVIFFPENDPFLDVEHYRYCPKYVKFSRPVLKLIDVKGGQNWHPFDKMLFMESKDYHVEGAEFGWFIESEQSSDLAEPLTLVEAIEYIIQDEGDNSEALSLVMQEWVNAFKKAIDAKETAIEDPDIPESALTLVSAGARHMGGELRELAIAMGYDMDEDDEVQRFLENYRDGTLQIDTENFGK
jgi:hypothetical protein